MQDEYGRPLSDDGQWVWDGSAWRPTGAGPVSGGTGQPGTSGYEPTMVAPREYGQPGSQQQYYAGASGPYPPGSAGPGMAAGPYGGPPPPTPWYQNRATLAIIIIAVLLVLSAVLVTILLVTRKGGSSISPTASPTAAAPTSAPTTEPTSPPPTTEAPTTPPTTPPTSTPPTTPPPPVTTISPGLYECTSAGTQTGTVSVSGDQYTTSSGAAGTYVYDDATGDIAFTGPDLGDYSGTYDPTGPSMDLESAGGSSLHCAQ